MHSRRTGTRRLSSLSAGAGGFMLPGRLSGFGPETADRIREILSHYIVVHGDFFAVERYFAGYAVAFVQVVRG